MLLDLFEGYDKDKTKSITMNDLFEKTELENLSNQLELEGFDNYGTYKNILQILYENKNFVNKYQSLLTKTL